LKEGEELLCFLIKSGFRANPFVAATLIDMQASGEAIEAAYRVFGELIERNLIACTTMINGYIPCCDLVTARRLFDLAPERDIVLWNTMISGYIEAGDIGRAQELFNKMPNKDVMSWKTALNGYASNGAGTACEDCLKSCQKGTFFVE
jgi:pentatricopeptide repeat protein